MSSLQEQVKDICRLADEVILAPSIPLSLSARSIGVCAPVLTFAQTGILSLPPLVGVVIWVFRKLRNKEIERQEKERMLREVIRKQQAVIRKLKTEVAESRAQNDRNRQEIENLKKMLDMLQKTENHLNAA